MVAIFDTRNALNKSSGVRQRSNEAPITNRMGQPIGQNLLWSANCTTAKRSVTRYTMLILIIILILLLGGGGGYYGHSRWGYGGGAGIGLGTILLILLVAWMLGLFH
jgi:hypothetical protein